MQKSLGNILENRVFNKELKIWENFDADTQQKYFDMFKDFLLSKCRQGSKMYGKIQWASLSQVKNNNCGLFKRLIIEEYDGIEKVVYICGQSWTEEIRILKNQFIKVR